MKYCEKKVWPVKDVVGLMLLLSLRVSHTESDPDDYPSAVSLYFINVYCARH